MKRIVLVSGLAGSGTSRISEALHRLGVQMAQTVAAPPAGTEGYWDWEDYLFVNWCGLPALMEDDPGRVLDYVRHRFQRTNVWGVKSPLLLPHLDLWRMIAKQVRAEVTLVLSQRSFEQCQESVGKWLAMDETARNMLLNWNEKCQSHWQREQANARLVPYGWTEFPITRDEVKAWM